MRETKSRIVTFMGLQEHEAVNGDVYGWKQTSLLEKFVVEHRTKLLFKYILTVSQKQDSEAKNNFIDFQSNINLQVESCALRHR